MLQRIRNNSPRAFIIALIAVAIVWLLTGMSERKRFREAYSIVYDGIDTVKYATTAMDTVVFFDITSNGFQAFNRGRHKKSLHIDVNNHIVRHGDSNISFNIHTEDYLETIKQQIDLHGVSDFVPVTEQLHISLAKRTSKVFHPSIEKVKFEFDGMMGLCGEPVIIPDSIVLYGSRESLEKIDQINAIPQTIMHISHSGKYNLKLSNDWEKYNDLRISSQVIKVYIPVERFIEKTITLPVAFSHSSSNGQYDPSSYRANLYPSSVEVTILIPQKDYSSFNTEDFKVVATLTSDTQSFLQPIVTQFPANARIKNVTPHKVQYIMIKK